MVNPELAETARLLREGKYQTTKPDKRFPNQNQTR